MSTPLREQLQAALGGAYTIERELGGGGMSHVFLAGEVALGRRVVAKVLAPELTVLSQDVFAVPAAALPSTRSVLTVVGGLVVHDALTRSGSLVRK